MDGGGRPRGRRGGLASDHRPQLTWPGRASHLGHCSLSHSLLLPPLIPSFSSSSHPSYRPLKHLPGPATWAFPPVQVASLGEVYAVEPRTRLPHLSTTLPHLTWRKRKCTFYKQGLLLLCMCNTGGRHLQRTWFWRKRMSLRQRGGLTSYCTASGTHLESNLREPLQQHCVRGNYLMMRSSYTGGIDAGEERSDASCPLQHQPALLATTPTPARRRQVSTRR